MTYQQGMAYELARELISSRIGHLSHELGVEEQSRAPSENRIHELEAQIVALAKERETLDPENDVEVQTVITRYSRTRALPEALSY